MRERNKERDRKKIDSERRGEKEQGAEIARQLDGLMIAGEREREKEAERQTER